MKRTLILLICVLLLFSGCVRADPDPSIIPQGSISAPGTEETFPEGTESFPQLVTEPGEKTSVTVDATYSDTTIPEEENSPTVDDTYSDTTIQEQTEPRETEPPATTEPVRETEPPPTTEPPNQAGSTEPEEIIPSQPVETTPEPEFDISYWISFAKSYAESIGLNLDATAVDCWDNPITAGSHCIYLERDIKNRLNRYSRDEDITDVWIWAVDLGNGSYDIYIGYA